MSEGNLLASSLNWTQTQFEKELQKLQDLYYNASLEESKQIISDQTYDQLIKIYESKFSTYAKVGALPREEKKEPLPFYMVSLSAKDRTPKELEL